MVMRDPTENGNSLTWCSVIVVMESAVVKPMSTAAPTRTDDFAKVLLLMR